VAIRIAMNIVKATRRFERWLGQRTQLVETDLRLKHVRMAEGAFPFFRATFYRWMQVWPAICPDLAKAPRLLAVGDLHVENFGTWRDVEGRLVWGVNDFDEAAVLPYTVDLVRLATSALLAITAGHIKIRAKDACSAILAGYQKSIVAGGRPFVLAEQNGWLRDIATVASRDPEHFWQRMDSLASVRGKIPKGAQDAIERLLPERGLICRFATRTAGLGSLGHARLVAIAEYNGGRIAREAKALVPSVVYWASGAKSSTEINYQAILSRAVRCPDPFVRLRGRWIVRRLAPYCSRIELSILPTDHDELLLLSAMGWETANIHLGTGRAVKHLRKHLKGLKPNWLSVAAKDMAQAVTEDWGVWKKSGEV
jgi:hypothetical protein